MSNILGSIIVQLKANVAEYVSGMGSAAYASRQASKEIRESFEGLGGALATVLGPFGAIGEHIAETFSRIGQFSGSAAANLGKLGGAMGVVGAAGGVAVGALAAIEAGAVGLSIHTAESIAALRVLSLQTQVSTEDLSGLGYAAKQSGVNQELLAKGLEKLNKAIFAAATSAPGAVNAFTRLGVAVRDTSSGEIRSTTDIFGDLAEKFKGMPEVAAKGALAAQIFGKSIGPDLLPFLDNGREGIAAWIAEAKLFGLVVDTETAEAAHRFEQNLNRLKAAGEGLSISLTRQLLPALELVSNALVNALKDKTGGLNDLISGTATLTKWTLALGDTFVTAFASLGRAAGYGVAQLEEVAHGLYALEKAPDFESFKAAYKDSRDRLKAIDQQFISDNKKAWQDNANFIENLLGPRAPYTVPHDSGPKSKVDTSTKEGTDKLADSIERTINTLRDQANAQLALAAATNKTVAEQRLQIAANEASAIITKLTGEADRATGAEHAKLIALIQRETTEIHALTAEKVVAADLVALNNELQKETLNYSAQIHALEELVSAYKVGGAAIGSAEIGKGLEKDRELLANAVDEWELLRRTTGVAGEAITKAAIAVINANAQLEKHEEQLRSIQQLNIAASILKSENAFKEELPALLALNQAYFQNAEAIREADVALKVAQYKADNEGATEEQIQRKTQLLEAQSKLSRDSALAREAANYDLIGSYNAEIAKLEDLGGVLQAQGRSTLQVEAAIYDAKQKAIHQWDEYAAKVGNATAKTRAFLNELQIQGQNIGQNIFAVFTKGIEGLEDQLAKLVVTGKANFRQLFESIAEGIAKAGIQKLVSSAAGAINQKVFGGAIPGLGGKPDGSSAGLALFVRMVDAGGNVLDSLTGGKSKSGIDPYKKEEDDFLDGKSSDDSGDDSGSSGILGKLGDSLGSVFSKISDTIGSVISKISSVISSIASTIGSVISSIAGGIGGAVKGIAGAFGGFLAGGGDVTPGKAYVVGEKHPEVFVPHKAGQVTPALRTPDSIAGFLGRSRTADSKGQAYVVGQKRPELFVARERGQVTPALKRPDIFTTTTIAIPPAARSSATSLPIAAIPSFPPVLQLPASAPQSTSATSLPIGAIPNITIPPALQLPTAPGPAARSTTSSSIAAIPNIFVAPAEVQAPGPATINIRPALQLPTAPGARATTASSPVEPAARIRTPESKPSEKRPDLFITYKTEQLGPIPRELRIPTPPAVTIPAAPAARSVNPLAGLFGGFLARGGDVTPGKAYIVGENREPEFFFPGQAGKVMPEITTGDSGPTHITNNFHFHDTRDFDSFRKSKGQLAADMQVQLAFQHGRNRG